MEVLEFRFFRPSDPCDDTPNWSRRYEWRYVRDQIAADPSLQKIHNTCCGPSVIHHFFSDRLDQTGREIVNSDFAPTDTNRKFTGFHQYDITKPHPETFDCALCISTLEELPAAEQEAAFHNLLAQVRPGGRLIITCDYPGAGLACLERLLGRPIAPESNRLNGANSTFPDPAFAALNVVLIDIRK